VLFLKSVANQLISGFLSAPLPTFPICWRHLASGPTQVCGLRIDDILFYCF